MQRWRYWMMLATEGEVRAWKDAPSELVQPNGKLPLAVAMNWAGERGWELVAITTPTAGWNTQIHEWLYFKKPLDG